MILIDVNVLVYAHREDAPDHQPYLGWLYSVINSEQTYGMAELVLSGFIRVATHPKVFDPPSSLDTALAFADQLLDQPNCLRVRPGPRHWNIFAELCRTSGAKGNLAADAYLAALAIEIGAEWITTDRDFARFPGLRWRHPLHPHATSH